MTDYDLHRCCLCWHSTNFSYIGEPPQARNLDWQSEVRAVRSREGKDDPFVTGRGYLSPSCRLVASPDPDISYETLRTDDPSDPLPMHSTQFTSGSYLAFAVHDACWQMLLRLLGPELSPPGDTQGAAKILFDLLAGMPFTPCGFLLPWNLSRYGTLRYDHTFGGFRTSSRVTNADYMSANPTILTLDIQGSEGTREGEDDLFQNRLDLKGVANFGQDVFAMLPAELNLLILTQLRSVDVCQLRLASRVIAEVSRPGDLPQAFWSSRFDKDHEMDFYTLAESPFATAATVDWRLLYCRVRSRLTDSTRTGHLRNRRLMWQNMRPVYECLSAYLWSLNPPPQSALSVPAPSKVVDGQIVRAESLPPVPDRLPCVGGTSRISTQVIWFPRDAMQSTWSLAASSRIISGESYLSGLRLLRAENNGDGVLQEVSRIGYSDHLGETKIAHKISPCCLKGLQVSSSLNGIVGLCVLRSSDCDDCPKTTYIENFDIHTSGIGVASLLPREGNVLRGIRVEIDMCKFTSIQILEEPQDHESSEPSDGHEAPLKAATAVPLWNRSSPTEIGTISFSPWTDSKLSQYSGYFLNMDFGGPGGSKLAHLTGIGVYMNGTLDDFFYGIGFFYGRMQGEVYYGSKVSYQEIYGRPHRLCQKFFPISGRGGERIVRIRVTNSKESSETDPFLPQKFFGQIRALDVFTNHGRSCSFRMYRRGSEASPHIGEEIDMVPPQGETLTGVLAKVKHSGGYILEMGFQSQKLRLNSGEEGGISRPGDQPSHIIPVLESHRWNAYHKSGHAGRNGMMFSSVKLSSIRRIRFAYGDSISNPRVSCRRASRISGLCFQFWDTDEYVYLGQWFNQFDTMDFTEGEYITKISVWHSRHLRASRHRGHNEMSVYGKVRGIKMVTSEGNVKHVQRDSLEDRLELTFGSETEELEGLIWAYDHSADHIQAVTRQKPVLVEAPGLAAEKGDPSSGVDTNVAPTDADTEKAGIDGADIDRVDTKGSGTEGPAAENTGTVSGA